MPQNMTERTPKRNRAATHLCCPNMSVDTYVSEDIGPFKSLVAQSEGACRQVSVV